jgi:6-pyruvoyltetrahydropterin/6-carboxytetrahydropterin synthase
MFRLKKKFTFEAAHQLPLHDGKCRRLHGHSWVGWLVCEGARLQDVGPKAGMLVDFGDLSAAVQGLREEYLDHHDLNRTTGLENPTSEALAEWVYHRLKPRLPKLAAVVIEETCTSSAEFRP